MEMRRKLLGTFIGVLWMSGAYGLAQDLYTQDGTDPTWQELLDAEAISIGENSTAGILGSTIDVNNELVEQGPNADRPIEDAIQIHTVGNSFISRPFFSRWSRWYQEDGNTQVMRLFKGEENVRNDRPQAARIEAFSALNWKRSDTWHEWVGTFMIVKPHRSSIFQVFNWANEWAMNLEMEDNGDIVLNHRRHKPDKLLARSMTGKRFHVRIRDNGHDFEVYFNGKFIDSGFYDRPEGNTSFRWGMYVGGADVRHDAMMFVTGATVNPEPDEIVDPGTGPGPGAALSAPLSDSNHLRYDFGTDFPSPVVSYQRNPDGGIGSHGGTASRNSRSPIHGFELPVFEDFNGIHSATYTVTLNGKTNNPDWDAQLYVFDPQTSPPSAEFADEIFWANSTEDTREAVRTIDLRAITPQTPTGQVSITIGSELLEGFYDENGVPVSRDGKIWFRLSEGRQPSGVTRYEIDSSPGSENEPTFSVTTQEAFIEPVPAGLVETNHVSYDHNTGVASYRSSQPRQIGGGGIGGNIVTAPIQGFTLPILSGPPESASFEYTVTGQEGSPYWNAHIYIFNPAIDPSVEAPASVWWASSREDGRGLVRTVSLDTIHINTAVAIPETVRVTLPAEILAGFYDHAGNPISKGGKIWFRLNPGRTPPSGQDFGIERYNVVPDSARLTLTEGPKGKEFADWAQKKIADGLDRSFAGSAVGDGVANAIKFAFGLDPMTPARAQDLLSMDRDESGRLRIRYQVDLKAEGISVRPEVSVALGSGTWFREITNRESPYVSIIEERLIEGRICEFAATAMNVDAALAVFMRVAVKPDLSLE